MIDQPDQLEIELRHVGRRVELLSFVVQIRRDVEHTGGLLHQGRAYACAVDLLQNKALREVVVERGDLQIVASRTEVFVALRTYVIDIRNRFGLAYLGSPSSA